MHIEHDIMQINYLFCTPTYGYSMMDLFFCRWFVVQHGQ